MSENKMALPLSMQQRASVKGTEGANVRESKRDGTPRMSIFRALDEDRVSRLGAK